MSWMGRINIPKWAFKYTTTYLKKNDNFPYRGMSAPADTRQCQPVSCIEPIIIRMGINNQSTNNAKGRPLGRTCSNMSETREQTHPAASGPAIANTRPHGGMKNQFTVMAGGR